MFFFQSKPRTPPPPPWGESSGCSKRKGDQFHNCLHTKVSSSHRDGTEKTFPT